MAEGVIIKSLSGFYYVSTEDGIIQCRARGKFRRDGMSPLVGDRVVCSGSGTDGRVDQVLPRKNSFIRPAVANVDYLVFIASNVNPVTDPWLIDRVSVIAENAGAKLIICVNKSDLDEGDRLYDIFTASGFEVVRTSAVTGEGIQELRDIIRGKVSAFTGNSGAGKSSILNAMDAGLSIETGEVSEKLGRGRHTTRHVELYDLGDQTFIADTPGFASFEVDMISTIKAEDLDACFIDFKPYLGNCYFNDCRHLKEPGCSVLEAVSSGEIPATRHESYRKLYDLCVSHKPWE